MLITRLFQHTIEHASIAILFLFSIAETADKFDCEDITFQNFTQPGFINSPIRWSLAVTYSESTINGLKVGERTYKKGERTTKPTVPLSIRSKSNIMQLHFTSDLSNNDKGFFGIFESIIEPSIVHPASISTTTSTLLSTSTEKSMHLPQMLYFQPHLLAEHKRVFKRCSEGQRIHLNIESFKTEACCDYWSIMMAGKSFSTPLKENTRPITFFEEMQMI
uniref:Uncharacterized protein n=1 Tax=Ditylenchus dipsaci TaxID=166011 RepID=A0A915DR60_9BILA